MALLANLMAGLLAVPVGHRLPAILKKDILDLSTGEFTESSLNAFDLIVQSRRVTHIVHFTGIKAAMPGIVDVLHAGGGNEGGPDIVLGRCGRQTVFRALALPLAAGFAFPLA